MLGYIQPYARFYSVGLYFLAGAYNIGGCWSVFYCALNCLMDGFLILGFIFLLAPTILVAIGLCFVGLYTTL